MRNLKFLLSQKGTAAVEFAILVPTFILFIFGLINFGFLLWERSAIGYSLAQTARYAFLNPTSNTTTLVNYAKTQATGVNSSHVSFNAVVTNTQVELTGTLNYTFIGMTLSPLTMTLKVRQPLITS